MSCPRSVGGRGFPETGKCAEFPAAPHYLSSFPQWNRPYQVVHPAFKHNTWLGGLYRVWFPACSPPCEWGYLSSAVLADVQGCDTVPSGSFPSLWAHAGHSTSDGVTLPSFSPSIPIPSLCLNRASPSSPEVPVSDLGSWGKGRCSGATFLPGPADGGLLGEVRAALGFGVGKGDDVVVLPPVLVHGCVQDVAAGGAGGQAGVVQHGNRGSGAHDRGVVALHELLIHLLVPLLPQEVTKERERSCERGECTRVGFPCPACQVFLEGLASSSWVQVPSLQQRETMNLS